MDFWHANVFGGIWASLILFINWILIFVTGFLIELNDRSTFFSFFSVCCKTTFRASMCSLLWHLLTIVAFCVLIGFDIWFFVDPYTCILTKNCSQQSQEISLNPIIRNHRQIANYTTEDPKRYFLRIQLFCACLVLILALLYVAIFNLCRFRYRQVMATMCTSKEEKTCPSVQDATLVWSTTSDFAPFTSPNSKSNLAFLPDKN